MKVRCYVSHVIIQSNQPDKMKPKTKKCFFISEGTLYDGQIKHILRASISKFTEDYYNCEKYVDKIKKKLMK